MKRYIIIVIGVLIVLSFIARGVYLKAYDILHKRSIKQTINFILENGG